MLFTSHLGLYLLRLFSRFILTKLFGETRKQFRYKIKTKKELLLKVNYLFSAIKLNRKTSKNKQLPKIVSKKIYIDNKEFAAKKIIKQWEKLSKSKSNFEDSNNWLQFTLLLKAMKINGIRSRIFNTKTENFKFSPFEVDDIKMRINRLKKILKIKKNVKCKLLSDKTILIKSC